MGTGTPDHLRLGNERTQKLANASLKASVNPAETNKVVEAAVRQHHNETGLYTYTPCTDKLKKK